MDEICVICTADLSGLGGAILLPCQCRVSYCHRCWDNCLAASLGKNGTAKCPTCRSNIRVDFDAQLATTIFSKVPEASVEVSETWQEVLDDILNDHGLVHDDEDFKFAVTDHRGHPVSLWARLRFLIYYADLQQCRGSLHKYLERCLGKIRTEQPDSWSLFEADIAAGPSIKNCHGSEVQSVEDLSKDQFPVLVKYPKAAGDICYPPREQRFPLTVTFKEYNITIDNTVGLPSLRETLIISPTGSLIVSDANVGLTSKWKDHRSGVQLHSGDWIIQVNTVSSTAAALMQELEKQDILRIRVRLAGSIAASSDVYDPKNATRERLSEQTKPRQLELLRHYGTAVASGAGDTVRLMCVCGGALQRLDLHSRVCRLVEPKDATGTLRYQGRRFGVEDLIRMGAVTCDLCGQRVEARNDVWMCENGENTILHAHSYDICTNCLKNATGQRERDRQLLKEQDHEYQESLRIDQERSRLNGSIGSSPSSGTHYSLAEFRRLHHEPPETEAQVRVRVKAIDGSHQDLALPSTAQVGALFAFAQAARWSAPLPSRFDLEMDYPKRSLKDLKEQTLQDAGLERSVLLRIVAL